MLRSELSDAGFVCDVRSVPAAMLPRRPRSPPPPPPPAPADAALANPSTIYTLTPAHAARAVAAAASGSSTAPAVTAGYTLNTAHQIRLKALEAERAHARLDQPMPRFVRVQPPPSAGDTETSADDDAAPLAMAATVATPFPAEPLPLFPSVHLQPLPQLIQQAPDYTLGSRIDGASARSIGPPSPAAAAMVAAPFAYSAVLAQFPGRTPIAMKLASIHSPSRSDGIGTAWGGGGAAHAASTTSFASSSAAASFAVPFAAPAAGIVHRQHHPPQPLLLNPITSPHSYTPSVAHLSASPVSHAKPIPSFTAHLRATLHPHPRDRPSYRPDLAAHPERSGPPVSSAMLMRQSDRRRQSGLDASTDRSTVRGLIGGRPAHSLTSPGWTHSTRVDDAGAAHRKLRAVDEEMLFGGVTDQQQQPPQPQQSQSQHRKQQPVTQSASEAQLAATILAHAIAARKSRPLAERKTTLPKRRAATGVAPAPAVSDAVGLRSASG